jgi:molybdate transport system substrate-binding protein
MIRLAALAALLLPLHAQELVVAAASDLASAAPDLTRAAAQQGLRVRFVLGSSGMLARQIEQGAPFDVFLSANQKFVDELAAAGKLTGAMPYALGRLALWSARPDITTLDALALDNVRHVAMANPAHAPYGVAAQQALESRGVWAKVKPKIVYGENVRQAYQFAESRNADAALTAWSLVRQNQAVLIPDSWHQPIRQTGAVVRASAHADQAKRFLDWLTGPAGQRLLREAGFGSPEK